ncbi:MAG: MFS transporter [Chlorogloea purpurea SAG 13.99]|nr:MFS transporter [Chlorogloea purpurea SAG 13.99]
MSKLIIEKIPILSQVNTTGNYTTPEGAENAALVFSGPQFFTALIAGVLLTFAFQLLLTNFGLAALMSLGNGSKTKDSHDSKTSMSKIGFYLGIATLITVSTALFLASAFAVKLSLLASPASGAIVGLVIWASYFSLMVWLSSTTLGSMVGTLLNTASAGLQTIIGTVSGVIGGKMVNRQVVATAEAAAAAVKRELGSGLDPMTLKENLQDYLDIVKPPELDWNKIRGDFESLLNDQNLQEAARNGGLDNIDKSYFVNLISDRSDLSKKEVERLADQLDAVWRKTVKQSSQKDPIGELVNYVKSGSRDQLLGEDFTEKIKNFLPKGGDDSAGGVGQGLSLGLNGLIGLVLGRTDLSDVDVEKIVGKLQSTAGKVGEKVASASDNYSPVRADIENYLLNAYPWQLKPQNLQKEFRDLLYDREADPVAVEAELESIRRADFVGILDRKGMLTKDQTSEIANVLNDIRLEVLSVARTAQEQQKALDSLARVENYLRTAPRSDLLTKDTIGKNLRPLLEDTDTDYEHLSNRLAEINQIFLELLLDQRHDLTPEEKSYLVLEIGNIRHDILQASQLRQAEIQSKTAEQWGYIQNYLKQTNPNEFTDEKITSALQEILGGAFTGSAAKQVRQSYFQRQSLQSLLTGRQDLGAEQIQHILDRVEAAWTEPPQQITGKVQEQYSKATAVIADYLRRTGKEELNPEGIKRDLNILLQDPSLGLKAIGGRLSRMDRDTLVQLLAQRKDLDQTQINGVIDEVQGNLQALFKAPRRLARRGQVQAQDFQSAIADYLRSTDKEALNPEGIQRDLKLLLNDPRLGMQNLKERLSAFDRSTLVALLSQREDINPQDVDRIIDQVMVVREQALETLQKAQSRITGMVESVFNKIRDYLNGLERPELNYDGIQQDLRKLFDDPEAGFDALRDRFSQIDKDTLIALLSSRDDISPAQAERIVRSVERSRDRILQRAERLQQQTQMRLEQIKQDAQKQMEETRKAAAKAAWWLFVIALVSAIAAAFGGALGVLNAFLII